MYMPSALGIALRPTRKLRAGRNLSGRITHLYIYIYTHIYIEKEREIYIVPCYIYIYIYIIEGLHTRTHRK